MKQKKSIKINHHSFSADMLNRIRENEYASNYWPLVYILSDNIKERAYVGETADALTRMHTHLKHLKKSQLTSAHLITCNLFNKSATLDIESSLIKYMAADGRFSLLNGNLGLVEHNYYQKNDLYEKIFKEIWNKLRSIGLAEHSLESINNSDLFKYSPYKSLSFDQRQGLLGIMHGLLDETVDTLIIEGGAGTGKSILAIFLFKLLQSEETDFNFREFSTEEAELRDLLQRLKQRYNNPKMALVIPMTSFRSTIKKAFRNISGLNADMVISPSELAKQRYDIVLVDESHRLRKRVNLGAYYGSFDRACEVLGFDKNTCCEVDWVCKQARKAIFFYDESQSIKPSDTDPERFHQLKAATTTQVQRLVSQFRVHGGNSYVDFVDALLNVRLNAAEKFSSKNYEFALFDSIDAMANAIRVKNNTFGLSRLIAGYSWPWASQKDPNVFDIEIEGRTLRWNSTNTDWINSKNSEHEVGCIHTTQGYDLNYAAIIFGKEIAYDKESNKIIIHANQYFDRNGKQSIQSPKQLKSYILNIYKTIMLRGIKGTFIYACNKDLHEYLTQHIPLHTSCKENPSTQPIELIPYVNAVPFYDLQAAAGGFSELQLAEHKDWIAVPYDIKPSKSFFACKVIGESMNKIIPNGATCLFHVDRGGSRNGKIVLVERSDNDEGESGSHYTIKEYESLKIDDGTEWTHKKILLKPNSLDSSFETIEITEDQSSCYRVVGEFVRVLD